jgi:F0F1-type ATP synthase alpha subunit
VRSYPLGDVTRYLDEMLAYVQSRHADLLERIRDKKELDDNTRAELDRALDAFAELFQPSGETQRSEAA